MEPKANENNSTSLTEERKVNKTWEAIQKHKGEISFTYPKWVKLLNELKESRK